jgi:DNA mismatch repair protein MutL
MSRIRLLDENTANRIAAGEVVERPASAVKELVENAIDAGARHIQVHLVEGGKQLIRVIDDGFGMNAEEAVLALQRHATSKITTADDLFAISTLGFRGEALPSIASISTFTLTTRARGELGGTCIRVVGGEIDSVEEIGAPEGTCIEVADLFFNTPARLKFLKSTATETARSIEFVGQLAMSHPYISFRLTHGQQEVLSTPGSGDPLGALAAIWGRETARRLVPIRYDSPGLMVTGFVCTPDLTRPGRSHELFFVNKRPIRNRLIGHALENAYRALTPESRYPIAALFFEVAPELVDVNVHPTKAEVKFTRDGEIHHAASEAVKKSLLDHGIVPQFDANTLIDGTKPIAAGNSPFSGRPTSQWQAQPQFEEMARAAMDMFRPFDAVRVEPESGRGLTGQGIAEYSGFTSLPTVESPPSPLFGKERERGMTEADPFASGNANDTPTLEHSDAKKPFAEQLRSFKVLGQARDTYIIALTQDGLAIIDQHVAHERVLYERLTAKRREHGIPVQTLAMPISLALGTAEAGLLTQRLDDFRLAGWEIEPFGQSAFLVRAAPAYLAKRDCEGILRDMIDELAHLSVARRLIVERDHVTITNACKMAVKAGDPLSMEEMTGLLAQLADTENPYLCPHGRPIVVTIPFGEIDKKFKRA